MSNNYKYKAFISYSHKDEKWGRWLHRGIEGYRIPKGLVGRDTHNGPVPRRLFPLFRDREELPTASDLNEIIDQALIDSSHLIVICSPNSAKSQWVNEEVKAFKKLGKQNRILCLIVDGEPNADSKPEMGLEECFPPAVKFVADQEGKLTDIQAEPIAADAREGKDGKTNAMMKVLAGLLGLGFDEIKQRNIIAKQKRAAIMVTTSLCLALIMGLMTVWAIGNSKEAERQKKQAINAKLESDKQKLEAERARDQAEEKLYFSKIHEINNLIKEKNILKASKIIQEVPPSRIDFEWGYLMNKANQHDSILQIGTHVTCLSFHPKKNVIFVGDNTMNATINTYDPEDEKKIKEDWGHKSTVRAIAVSKDGEIIITGSGDKLAIVRNSLLEMKQTLEHQAGVNKVGISKDGKSIFTISGGRINTWNYEKKNILDYVDVSNPKNVIIPSTYKSPENERVNKIIDNNYQTKYYNADSHGNSLIIRLDKEFSITGLNIVSANDEPMRDPTNFRIQGSSDSKNYYPIGEYPIPSFTTRLQERLITFSNPSKKFKYFKLEFDTAPGNSAGFQIAEIELKGIEKERRIIGSFIKRDISSHVDEKSINMYNYNDMAAADFVSNESILTGSIDGVIRIWEAFSGRLLKELSANKGPVRCISISKCGKFFVSGSYDNNAIVWDLKNGNKLFELKGHSEEITCVDICPNSQWILTGSKDDSAIIWNALNGKLEKIIKWHTSDVTAVKFNYDGSKFATGSLDTKVIVWSTNKIKNNSVLHHGDNILSMRYDKEGEKLAVITRNNDGSDYKVTIWDPIKHVKINEYNDENIKIFSVSFNNDGDVLLMGTMRGEVKKWNLINNKVSDLYKVEGSVLDIFYTPDGNRIITDSYTKEGRVVDTWSLNSNSKQNSFKYNGNFLRSLSSVWTRRITIEKSGNAAPIYQKYKNVGIWDSETGEGVRWGLHGYDLDHHLHFMRCLTFSPDNNNIATGSNDKTIRIWDSKLGGVISVFEGHVNEVISVCYSPNGKRIASGGSGSGSGELKLGPAGDNTIRIWDVHSGENVLQILVKEPVSRLLFNSKGNQLAASCLNKILLFNSFKYTEAFSYAGKYRAKYMNLFLKLNIDGSCSLTPNDDYNLRVTGEWVIIGEFIVCKFSYSDMGGGVINLSFDKKSYVINEFNDENGNLLHVDDSKHILNNTENITFEKERSLRGKP